MPAWDGICSGGIIFFLCPLPVFMTAKNAGDTVLPAFLAFLNAGGAFPLSPEKKTRWGASWCVLVIIPVAIHA